MLLNILSVFLKKFINGVNQRKQEEKKLLETQKECIEKLKKECIERRFKRILEAWYKDNMMHPYASKTELQELHLVTGLEKKKIKRWLDNRRVKQSKTEDKPRKLFSSEEKNILLSFFKNTSEHPGPADLSMLANLIEKDSKKIQQWFARQRFLKKKTTNCN